MKKIIPLILLFGCSEEKQLKFEHEKVEIQDTLLASIHNEISNMTSSLSLKEKREMKVKDSLKKQITKLHHKNKNLQYENDFYLDAIDGYSEVLMSSDTIK